MMYFLLDNETNFHYQLSSMEEKGGSAASKHGGGCKISNCKARPKDEDTTKAVRKHKSKYDKRRRLVLKRKAEKRKEIMNKIPEARNGDMETETSCRDCTCSPQFMLRDASGLHKKFQKAVFDYFDYMSLGQC